MTKNPNDKDIRILASETWTRRNFMRLAAMAGGLATLSINGVALAAAPEGLVEKAKSLKGDAMAMAFNGLYAVIAAKAEAEKEAAVRRVIGDRLAPAEQKETPEQRHDRLHAEFWAQQKGGKQ